MKKSALRFAAVAAMVAGFTAQAVELADDPDIGWIVSNDSTRDAVERLTAEEEAAGVIPWIIRLGGSWGSCSMDSVQQVGTHTTLDLGKKFWRQSSKSILHIKSGMKGKAFQNKTTIQKLILFDDALDFTYSGNGEQFSGCTGLVEVSPFLPSNLASVPTSFFSGCTSLTGALNLPGGTSVGNYSFSGTKITSATVGDPKGAEVINICKQAFLNCTNLTTVVICSPAGWKTTSSSGAGENFKGCTALKDFTMMSFPAEMQTSAFATHAAKSTLASNKYKIRFLVPQGVSDPDGLLTGGITPWSECDQTVKDAYAARWPDEKAPLGVIKDTQSSGASYHYGTYNLPANQFVAYIPDVKSGLTLTIK